MERQTKHRILGVFVIIGLVIILLPLFQSNKELTTETVLVKTPPFPDQPVQTTEELSTEHQANLVPPVMDNMTEASENISKPTPDDIIRPVRPSVNPLANASGHQILENKNAADAFVKKSVHIAKLDQNKNEKAPAAFINADIKSLTATPKNTTIDDEALLKLKGTVWVVQIGSFKNKANALRLVNQLRSNGYRAFIQSAANSSDTTRVFVGPEHTKPIARDLANRLQNEMKIHGIVVSYKPLTL